MRSILMAIAAATALACPPIVRADPITVDVILGLESFGRVAVDPSGQIGVFEVRRSRADLPRHDVEAEGANRYARLYRVDLAGSAPPEPLLTMEDAAGYTAGSFSPNGRRLAVFRLRDDEWRLGIVETATGRVVWTDVAPDLGLWGRALEWLSDDVLVVIGTPDGALPSRLAGARVEQARLVAMRAAAAGGSPAAVTSGQNAHAMLSPRRLFRINALTGDTTAVADGPFLDLEVSPDGRHAAILLDGPLLPPPPSNVPSEVRRARGLQIVSLIDGTLVTPAGAHNISTSLIAWSPDSDAVLVADIDRDPARLLAVTPGGSIRDVTPPGVVPSTPIDFQGMATAHGGWLGTLPIVRGRSGQTEGWFGGGVEGSLAGMRGDVRLVAEGGSAVLFNVAGRILRIDHDGHQTDLGAASSAADPRGPFGFRGQNGPMKRAFAVVTDGDGRACRAWADRMEDERCVSASPGAAISWSGNVAMDRSRVDDGPNTLRLQRGDRRTVVWRLNPQLDVIDVAEPRRVSSAGGLGGWLYLPSLSAEPPPVIVVPYQGDTYPSPPSWMRRESVSLSMAPQILVAAGYAVLIPDLPETAEPADGLAERILSVVDAAAAESLVDASRIGLWGWSFGAWTAAMSAAQSPRFSAVVGLNGPMNFSTVIGDVGSTLRLEGGHALAAAGSARWLESGQAGMMSAYWAAPDRYRRNSPFDQADRISAPTLLVVGEYDFMLAQSEQLFGALHRLGRPVALTLLIGEDHGLQNPGNIRLYYQQVRDWFDHHLMQSETSNAHASSGSRPPPAPN